MSRTLNPYFNQLGAKNEQRLVEDLIIESIQKDGMVIFYIPRTSVALDTLFGEDPQSKFTKSVRIEAYFDNPQGFEGNRAFVSKFGLELGSQANFIISRRRFNQVMKYDGFSALPQTNYAVAESRPLEGDLIYMPLTNDLFEISFVEHESVFHQLGYRFIWRIDVQKFQYSSETIQTGIPQIDTVQDIFQNLDSTFNDPIADNSEIVSEITDLGVFTETNPFGEPDHD